jgi:hypothetical protein
MKPHWLLAAETLSSVLGIMLYVLVSLVVSAWGACMAADGKTWAMWLIAAWFIGTIYLALALL